jgi:hypothetical protein
MGAKREDRALSSAPLGDMASPLSARETSAVYKHSAVSSTAVIGFEVRTMGPSQEFDGLL